MSSKVLGPEESGSAETVCWGSAGTKGAPVGKAERAAAAPQPAPDLERRMAELQQEAERRVREAQQAGMREGEKAGRRAAEAELRPVVERLGKSIEEIAALRPALAAQAEAGLLKLAVAIARRILHRELSLDPEALGAIVRAALDRLSVEDVCRVRVHPDLAQAVRAALAKGSAGRAIEVQGDGSLERGGAVVETGRGKLDASVESQLVEIERGLADRLRRHS